MQTVTQTRRGRELFILLAGFTLGTMPVQAQDAPAERKASTGVFTAAQANRGETVYKVNCVSCHSVSDYTGETFTLGWVTKTAFDIFDVIRSQMPEDNPGILARQEYVDVVAYIFSLNSYPTGSAELPSDDATLKKVRIDALPPKLAAAMGTRVVQHPVLSRHR